MFIFILIHYTLYITVHILCIIFILYIRVNTFFKYEGTGVVIIRSKAKDVHCEIRKPYARS